MASIKVIVNTKGHAVVTVNGCPGPNCKSLTEKLEKALGAVTEDRKTEEYYSTTEEGQQQCL